MNYKGVDNLEWMSLARNYNTSLLNKIKKRITHDILILDFGAGTGEFCNPLKNENFNIHAFEIDQVQQIKLKNNGIITFGAFDELENCKYDFIYSLNVLEHIENDSEVLSILKMKLKSGGILFLYLPAFNILYSSMDKKVGHYRRYKIKTLKEQLTISGYQIQQIRYFDSLGFFVSLLFKMFDNEQGKASEKSLVFFDKFVFPLNKFMDRFLYKILGKNIIAVAKTD